MKALVTGASGFIGSTLIEELGTLGFEVHALMRKTSSDSNLGKLKFTRVEGDLSDEESLRKAVREMNYVFHLAGATTALNREAFFEHNARGTERLARVVAEERPGLQRFVYVSSQAAAGPATSLDHPVTESAEPRPVSLYGESKLEGERALLRYKSVYPVSIVRPPMVYGPKDKGVFTMIQTVARNLMPIPASSGGGDKHYSVIHVRDLCRGIVQSALAPVSKVPSGEVFFLANDRSHTYQEIMSTIAEGLGRDPLRLRLPRVAVAAVAATLTGVGWLTKKPFPLNWDKLNELRPDYWVCSNEKARRLLGFAPEFDLAGGMANAIEWYRRNKWL